LELSLCKIRYLQEILSGKKEEKLNIRRTGMKNRKEEDEE
jgi:hypothetical protein